jgi:ribosomal protein L11|tara:strand:- start:449 stop:934 length:486 start_codon:yes stop_codon:yes gene_type:complete
MDPMSLIAVASTAFNAIKSGFEHGREIESMAGDIGRWMGAIKDVKEGAAKKRKKTYGSIEEAAFEEFAALKEAERMENELRQFVNMNYGPSSWNEIVRIQAQIRVREQEEIAQAKRDREEAIEKICIWIAVVAVIGLIVFMGVVAWNVAQAQQALLMARIY